MMLIWLAMEEFRWDIERCAELAFDTSLETVAAVAQDTYRWARTWVALRHPNPKFAPGSPQRLVSRTDTGRTKRKPTG